MANWCRGILKIRGTRENIIKFLTEEVVYFVAEKQSDGKYKNIAIPLLNVNAEYKEGIEFEECSRDLKLNIKYFKRCLGGVINCLLSEESFEREDGTYIVPFDFETKWGIIPDEFIALSKTCGVDIRGKFYECGMEFTQEIEVIDGDLTLWKELDYKDYEWECENPYWGG